MSRLFRSNSHINKRVGIQIHKAGKQIRQVRKVGRSLPKRKFDRTATFVFINLEIYC
jgi:hypothetical protein